MTIIQWEISKKAKRMDAHKNLQIINLAVCFFGVKSPSEWPNQLSNFLSYNETFLYS